MVHTNEVNVTGTLIWYYFICKREVWLMSRQLTPDQENTDLALGRFFHEESYNRNVKEISLGNIVIDVIKKDNGRLIVGEVKKTSKFKKSAKMQLLFYLKQLRELGIEVELTEKDEEELERVVRDILRIIYLDKPPKAEKIRYCRNCAYNEICYA